jgi:hypothetical protein
MGFVGVGHGRHAQMGLPTIMRGSAARAVNAEIRWVVGKRRDPAKARDLLAKDTTKVSGLKQ